MPAQWVQILAGLGLGAVVAGLAYLFEALTLGGAFAAALLGTVVFGLGGWPGAVLLLTFFISSTALSRVARGRKKEAEANYAKGGRRDAGQALANGGVAGVFMILHAFFPLQDWPWIGFAGSLAAATADTWATELGVLSPWLPRMITNGKKVAPGTSGGVSLFGLAAALMGAALISFIFGQFWQEIYTMRDPNIIFVLVIGGSSFFPVLTAGFLGSLLDSLLGATLQAIYYCPACQKETERHPFHSCGTPTTLLRGLRWLNNDWVNAMCTLTGGIAAIILALIVF